MCNIEVLIFIKYLNFTAVVDILHFVNLQLLYHTPVIVIALYLYYPWSVVGGRKVFLQTQANYIPLLF